MSSDLSSEQKARPILFSAPMVRALLDGRKTQTRRIVKWKTRDEGYNLNFSGIEAGLYHGSDASSGWVLRSRGGVSGCWNDRTWPIHCPYGKPGELLWVRETHAIVGNVDPGWVLYRASGYENECRRHKFDSPPPESEITWKPSIHMPRWASRITLRLTDVRVERLQDISYEDGVAEGCGMPDMRFEPVGDGETWEQTSRRLRWPQRTYESLWNSINGRESWDANPWVWVVSFERVENVRAAA